MGLRDFVEALVARDALTARQWAADAAREALIWTEIHGFPGIRFLGTPESKSRGAWMVPADTARSAT